MTYVDGRRVELVLDALLDAVAEDRALHRVVGRRQLVLGLPVVGRDDMPHKDLVASQLREVTTR